MQLPSVGTVNTVPLDSLPGLLTELAALMPRGALRTAVRHDGNECEVFDVEKLAQRLKMSTDTLREHGEVCGVARIRIRDIHRRPAPVVYPRTLLAAFLWSEGCKVASLAVAR